MSKFLHNDDDDDNAKATLALSSKTVELKMLVTSSFFLSHNVQNKNLSIRENILKSEEKCLLPALFQFPTLFLEA